MAKQSLNSWEGRYGKVYFWLAIGLGSGLLRPAPGTWGTLPGLLISYLCIDVYLADSGAPGFAFIGLILMVLAYGMLAIDKIEAESGVHDAPEIVIDEWAGMMVTALPLIYFSHDYKAWIVAFILFRLFDIVKPWPISWLDQQVEGGFGVMIDDIVAGIQAALLLYALLFFQVI